MHVTSADVCLHGLANAIILTATGLETSGFGVERGHGNADLEEDGFD
jgi:hypothetical protein